MEISQNTSKTRTRRLAEVSSSKDCYTIGKTTFAYRSWSEASRLRNSALKIRSDLASALFNCDHHFSALCSSSQTISVHVNSSPNSSQLFSFFSSLSTSPQFFFIAFHLFSSRLFSPDASPHLNSSHLLLEVERLLDVAAPLGRYEPHTTIHNKTARQKDSKNKNKNKNKNNSSKLNNYEPRT